MEVVVAEKAAAISRRWKGIVANPWADTNKAAKNKSDVLAIFQVQWTL